MMVTMVGLCGGTCSGKSTLSRRLLDTLSDIETAELSFDSYYRPLGHLPLSERQGVNFDHPDSLDLELFRSHLACLKRGEAVEEPLYSFECHDRLEQTRRVEPAKLILVDGILLLADADVRAQLDYIVFVDVPADIRLGRRLARDQAERGRSEDSVRRQFAETVAPMHDAFVQPGKAHADLVLDGTRPPEELVLELRNALLSRLR